MSQKRAEYVLKMSWRRDNNSLTWWYVLKTSWSCLEDIFSRGLDVFKTSWRRLGKTSWRKTPSRCITKTNIFVLIKVSWRSSEEVWLKSIYSSLSRRLEDVFWRWRRKTSSRRLQDIFIKANVCWDFKMFIAEINIKKS